MVICLKQGADFHMAQLIPLPLTVSCFIKLRLVLKGDNGCHVGPVYFECIVYADNIIILLLFLIGFQVMLDACTAYGRMFCCWEDA